MIKDILYSIRPSACVITSFLVLGAFRPRTGDFEQSVVLAICAFAGSAYCFLVNDLFDRKKDLLNNKNRPIATGKLSIKAAWISAIFFALTFVVMAFFLGWIPFGLSFLFLFIVTGYSYVNNAQGFMANLIVGFIASGTQWGVAIIRPDTYLIYSSLLFFFIIVAREIMLDWLDIEGDKAVGKSSIPARFNGQVVSVIVSIFYLAGTIVLVYTSVNYGSSLVSHVFQYLAFVALWVPFFYLIMKKERVRVLQNIRSTHIALVFILVALFTR